MTDAAELMNKTDITMPVFEGWPKTPRLFKDCTITEKIDGTNAAVVIIPQSFGTAVVDIPNMVRTVIKHEDDDGSGFPQWEYHVYAQSRKRFITPDSDNYGFAAWVEANAQMLVEALGAGRHYGEWWGKGIQRGYGMTERVFSLFNVNKWDNGTAEMRDIGVRVVPRLYVGRFDTHEVNHALERLIENGSLASPGYDDPEGVCVFHHASRTVFKALLDGDDPKGGPRDLNGNVIQLPVAA